MKTMEEIRKKIEALEREDKELEALNNDRKSCTYFRKTVSNTCKYAKFD